MKHGQILTGLTLAALCLAGPVSRAATVDFDYARAGTLYGHPDYDPGDVVHTQDNIDMSVEWFFCDDFIGFFKAEVSGLYGQMFPTQALDLNNISVLFDFSRVGFDVRRVTLEYMEFGGVQNFGVNRHTINELMSLSDIPVDIAPGVTAEVDSGLITLTGDIDNFIIGGQELAIDTVTALPEPTAILLLIVGGGVVCRRSIRGRRRG